MRKKRCWSPLLLIVAGAAIGATGPVFADDTARNAVNAWRNSLKAHVSLAVKYRQQRLDHVFQSVEEHTGVFYRDEKGRSILRLDESVDRPLSAVKDVNSKWTRTGSSNDPGLVFLWDESSIKMRSGTYSERALFRPPSALYPANHRTIEGWRRSKAGFIRLEHFSSSVLFPLLFVESSEVEWYDAQLLTTPKSANVCLRLSQSPDSPSDHTKSLDALFRPGEHLPYAVRRFDPSGTNEYRFFIESIQMGEEAQIPDDAFSRTTSH